MHDRVLVVAQLLQQWAANKNLSYGPAPVACPLEFLLAHAHTEDAIRQSGVTTLKGHDHALAWASRRRAQVPASSLLSCT